jgi:4-hydroxybenzoate polyprenyltransferase
MTLEKIREKARELHAKTRRQALGTAAGPLVVVLCYAFDAKEFPALQHTLQPLFALAFVWSLAGVYFLNRGRWPAAMPGDAGFAAGLEFCRREIERRRDYFRRVLVWGFGPVLLAIAGIILALAMVAGREIFPKAMPFLTLVVVWIVAYFAVRAWQQRELQQEIDELNEIERENRA